MLFDLSLGQGKISGSGRLKSALYATRSAISAWVARKKIKLGLVDNKDLLPSSLKLSDTTAVYARTTWAFTAADEKRLSELFKKTMEFDSFVPGLLRFSPDEARVLQKETAMVKNNKLVFQDKASCLPVLALDYKVGQESGDIIEACAAPGSKTMQLINVIFGGGFISHWFK